LLDVVRFASANHFHEVFMNKIKYVTTGTAAICCVVVMYGCDFILFRSRVHYLRPCWRILKQNKRKARKSVDTMR